MYGSLVAPFSTFVSRSSLGNLAGTFSCVSGLFALLCATVLGRTGLSITVAFSPVVPASRKRHHQILIGLFVSVAGDNVNRASPARACPDTGTYAAYAGRSRRGRRSKLLSCVTVAHGHLLSYNIQLYF